MRHARLVSETRYRSARLYGKNLMRVKPYTLRVYLREKPADFSAALWRRFKIYSLDEIYFTCVKIHESEIRRGNEVYAKARETTTSNDFLKQPASESYGTDDF